MSSGESDFFLIHFYCFIIFVLLTMTDIYMVYLLDRFMGIREHSGRVEERPTELGTSISIADAEWAEQEARMADS